MFTPLVIVRHPHVQRGLRDLDRRENFVDETLFPHCLMQTFDLARRRRRIGRGENMVDAVVSADAIEQDHRRLD